MLDIILYKAGVSYLVVMFILVALDSVAREVLSRKAHDGYAIVGVSTMILSLICFLSGVVATLWGW